MKRKYFFAGLFLILVMFLVGCGGVITPSINLTGSWTMTNASGSTVNTSKCNIVDSSGSLTIYNFYNVGEEYINWNTGYGTFNGSAISINMSGSYTNIYFQTVSIVIYFEGTISSSGISGSGTWVETLTVGGNVYISSGSTILIKG